MVGVVKDRPLCECGKPTERDGVYWRSICSACRERNRTKPRLSGLRFYYSRYKLDFNHCQQCNWEGICDVHHIDGNRQNNTVENLQILCPNCHRAIHHPYP